MVRVTTWPACFIEVFEQPELTRLERDLLAAANDPMRQPVEFEIGDPILGFLAPAGVPAGQHLDPREQLGERIGLGQVVVAAGAQPADPVVDRAEGREDECRGRVAFGRAAGRSP